MTEQATETTSKRGRPRAAPTRMTTVNIPAYYHAPAPQIVAQIEDWMSKVNVNELVTAAAEMITIRSYSGQYTPYVFQIEDFRLPVLKKDGREYSQRQLKKYKFSFRLPVSLYDQIQDVARKLAAKPSDVIRFALTGAYLGEEGLRKVRGGNNPKYPPEADNPD